MFFYEVLLSGAAHFVYIAGLHLFDPSENDQTGVAATTPTPRWEK